MKEGRSGRVEQGAKREEEERTRVLELPSNDRVPLVESERKVSVTLDPLGVVCSSRQKRRGEHQPAERTKRRTAEKEARTNKGT